MAPNPDRTEVCCDGGSRDVSAGASNEADTAGRRLEPPSGPTPNCPPERIVRALLRELEAAGTQPSAALRPVFTFAAPSFRHQWGSLDGFVAAFSGPIYEPLYTAATLERGPLERTDDRIVQTVLARGEDGPRTFEVGLVEQTVGKYADCWMVDTVEMVYDGESPAFRRMATVDFEGNEIRCADGATLRDVLLRAEGRSPYNDVAEVANCGGNGLCGTCAVTVEGPVDEPSRREKRRLSLPPHTGSDDLRLSCQTCVQGDLVVDKRDGLWGHHTDRREDVDREQAAPIPVTDAEYEGRYSYAAVDGGDAQ